jgi:hypothetical protein
MKRGKHVVSVASLALSIVCGTMSAVPSKATPPIFRAVVNLGAETIVMTGVVVVVATVASLFAEVTDVTVPPPALPLAAAVTLPLLSTVILAAV